MNRYRVSHSVFALALLTVAAVAVGFLNLREQRRYRLPEDGVVWRASLAGVLAESLDREGPAARAGLVAGDVLAEVNCRRVRSAADVTRQLFALGAGAGVRYGVVRQGFPAEFDLVLAAQARPSVRFYLQLAGVLYLALGLLVLWRRAGARTALHFYLFCLTSFVLFVFSYVGRLDAFDWGVYWASVAALLLLPALFLHFFLSYPPSLPTFSGPPRKKRAALLCIYGPAALLGLVY